MKIITRLIYGNTSRPRYIRNKNIWVYNNKKYLLDDLITNISNNSYNKNNYAYHYKDGNIEKTTTNFDELISEIIKNPHIIIQNNNCFSPKEYNILCIIKERQTKELIEEYNKTFGEIKEKAAIINGLFK